MTSHAVVELLEEAFPETLAVEGDATGLQIDPGERTLQNVLLAYELTDRVMDRIEATEHSMVVAFHPLIYRPLSRITPDDRVGRMVLRLISAGIPLFITHTRLDAHPRGTNTLLASSLGGVDAGPLVPGEGPEGSGMGRVAEFPGGISFEDLVDRVSEVTRSSGIRTTVPGKADRIERVAIVAGSGMSYYREACRSGVNAMITADVRYHDFHAADDLIPIIDPGHAESEVFVLEATSKIIAPLLPSGVELVRIEGSTNPIDYR